MSAPIPTARRRTLRLLIHLHPRLLVLRLRYAWTHWQLHRMAGTLERAHGLPAGWLLVEANAELFRDWQVSRARGWAAAGMQAP